MTDGVWVVRAGLVTSLGHDLPTSWRRLVAGDSGIARINRFQPDGLPTQVAASVQFDGQETCSALALRMARLAVEEALADDPLPEAVATRTGVFVGCAATENDWRRMIRHDAAGGGANRVVHYEQEVISLLGEQIADRLGSLELPMHLNTACASAATALTAATESIRDGEYEAALVVGSDASVYEESIAKFCLLSAMTTRNAEPSRACKPFASDRDGFVMGEGAGALLLVSERLARRLGLDPLAAVRGVGSATDNFHRTRSSPDGSAIVRSMKSALADAGLAPDAIGHVNAHGTGTPENDKMESMGLRLVFGDHTPKVPVTANKSQIGHTLTAAGIVEAIISIESLRHRTIPPTLNHDNPDDQLGISVVGNVAAPFAGDHVLSNSFGFGGQNVSLVLSRV